MEKLRDDLQAILQRLELRIADCMLKAMKDIIALVEKAKEDSKRKNGI